MPSHFKEQPDASCRARIAIKRIVNRLAKKARLQVLPFVFEDGLNFKIYLDSCTNRDTKRRKGILPEMIVRCKSALRASGCDKEISYYGHTNAPTDTITRIFSSKSRELLIVSNN